MSDVVAECLARALVDASLDMDRVWLVAVSDGEGAVGVAEREGVVRALGGRQPEFLSLTKRLGDTGGAASVMQTAAVLARHATLTAGPPRYAAVTAVDGDGMVGCAVLCVPCRPHDPAQVEGVQP